MCIQGGPEKMSAWSSLALCTAAEQQREGNIETKCMGGRRQQNKHFEVICKLISCYI